MTTSREAVTVYGTSWCSDCRSAKRFLKERGVEFREVNIDEEEDAEALVLRVNNGRRKVPTIQVGERYFACSPFNPEQLARELGVPVNPQPVK